MRFVVLLAGLSGLVACGDTTTERAVLGAGGGAIAGKVIANDPVTGAAAGAAANVLYCQQYPGRC